MIFHDPVCLNHVVPTEFDGNGLRPYPEKPDRVTNIIAELQYKGKVTSPPQNFDTNWIEEIHTREYLDFIARLPQDLEPCAPTSVRTGGKIKSGSSFYAKLGHFFFDPATPVMGQTAAAAFGAVDCCLSLGRELVTGSSRSYALCRPPGHHARPGQGGGYCIFNNVAIVANYLSRQGKSVTILDLDYHHGNGTQEIFYERDDVQYLSLHADPTESYPFYWGWVEETGEGVGKGLTTNFPLPSTTSEAKYLETLDLALAKLDDYQPEIVLVSMGFDCYVDDPIAGMGLTTSSYAEIGKRLADLNQVGLVLEGGYHLESIGQNFVTLMIAMESV